MWRLVAYFALCAACATGRPVGESVVHTRFMGWDDDYYDAYAADDDIPDYGAPWYVAYSTDEPVGAPWYEDLQARVYDANMNTANAA